MRGVFFVLFCLLVAPKVHAIHYTGELSTKVGTTGTSSSLNLDFGGGKGRYAYQWGLDADLDFLPSLQGRISTRWELALSITDNLKLIGNHNQDHFTSGDIFRLINKNQYIPESYWAGLQSPQLSLGYLRQVPFKSRDVVDALFLESRLDLGHLAVRGLQIRYAGQRESGSAAVLQAEGKLGGFQVEGATAWQVDLAGRESYARVLQIRGSAWGVNGRLCLKRVEPGFLSLLAKTNQFTPNRQGWELELSTELCMTELGVNLRRQTNLEGSREYPKLAWKLGMKEKQTSIEWRVQPTPALVMRYSSGDTLFQLDPLNATFRTDWKMGDAKISLRVDALRQIGRAELRFGEAIRWRLIGKYDFLADRSHYSCLVAYRNLQLEVGEYDRGNMSSGFNDPFSYCISWVWEF